MEIVVFIGHCAVGYVDGEIPKAAKGKKIECFGWIDNFNLVRGLIP